MENEMMGAVQWLLFTLALPAVGLPAIFLIALVSATLLPLGSEPAVFAYLKLSPDMFWAAVLVATAGNTIGGVVSYYMGYWAKKGVDHWKKTHQAADGQNATAGVQERRRKQQKLGGTHFRKLAVYLRKMGPWALLFSWLPIVGDPLCSVAGWMKLRLLPCIFYMAIGKFVRYVVMTAVLLRLF
ncbi:MAG: DedA family protein [Alcaligenaceae bacterium]|nr:DedA family protein [Alcaligenaceae bacterium]